MSHSPLPDNWRCTPIGNVLVSAQYGLNLPVTEEGTVPIIGMRDMVEGRVKNRGWGCVQLSAGDSKRFLLSRGDILLNRTNSPDLVGKVSLWNRHELAVFPSYIVRFRVDDRHGDPEFVNYVLNSDDGQARLKSLSTRGVSQANINPTTFRKAFEILLPPLVEQAKIAGILNEWDQAIILSERIIKKSRLHRDTIAFAVQPDKTAILRPLGDYFTERKERGRTGLPVYSVTLDEGLKPRGSLDRRTESTLGEQAHALVEEGDLAYNMMRMWQGALGVAERPCLVSPAYVVMRPKPSVDARFAVSWMKSKPGLNRLRAYSHGITDDRLRLYAGDFLSIPVAFPPVEQQRLIGEAYAAAAVTVQRAETLVSLLRRQKQGLMQKLLTGEWRVPTHGDSLAPGGPAAERLDAAA